ncbi:MAG: cupin domain-containing protein [Burkholderiales bacterium]|nr:cupin domain-containing protein [Burkholderiales bacterium]
MTAAGALYPPPARRLPGDTLTPMTARLASRLALLGQRTPRAFLASHWHKQALLVRAALPGFAGLFTRDELVALAGRDDVESRLVVRDGARYTLAHGPFRKAEFRALPARDWTLLVQGVNLHADAADALLRRFAFLPYARLDDLMVSYAAPGGGVGPHFDSYDVFLLQGFGRRRWRYGMQDDLTLKPGLPVKILRRFAPQHDAVLAPGDMLYLPPAYAHDGVAIDACTTFSIGFRAASHTELAQAFLDYLRDRIDLPGRYADPDAKPAREPARIGYAMHRRIARALAAVRWDRATVERFLGTMLSEPKPSVFFTPPARPLARTAFAAALRRRGLTLDRRTQWLYDDACVYVNGEAHAWPAGPRAALATLANARALSPRRAASLSPAQVALVHEGYRHGYAHLA